MVVGVVPDADGFTDETADAQLSASGLLDEDGPRADVFRGAPYARDAYGDDAYGGDDLTGPGDDDAGGLTARIRRRSPGSLEAEILNVLHTARRELSPAQVRERLASGATLSYSAVVTTLTRLHGKGVVTRRRAGRAFLYLAESDAASLVAWRMNRLLDEQADHRPALTHFVAALSPGDEALIRQLLGDGSTHQDRGAAAPGTPGAGDEPGPGSTGLDSTTRGDTSPGSAGSGSPGSGSAGSGDTGSSDTGSSLTAPRDGRRGTGTGRAPTGG